MFQPKPTISQKATNATIYHQTQHFYTLCSSSSPRPIKATGKRLSFPTLPAV